MKSDDEFPSEDYVARLEVRKRRTLEELKGSLSSERAYPGKEAERAAAKESIASFDRDPRKLGVEFMEPE